MELQQLKDRVAELETENQKMRQLDAELRSRYFLMRTFVVQAHDEENYIFRRGRPLDEAVAHMRSVIQKAANWTPAVDFAHQEIHEAALKYAHGYLREAEIDLLKSLKSTDSDRAYSMFPDVMVRYHAYLEGAAEKYRLLTGIKWNPK